MHVSERDTHTRTHSAELVPATNPNQHHQAGTHDGDSVRRHVRVVSQNQKQPSLGEHRAWVSILENSKNNQEVSLLLATVPLLVFQKGENMRIATVKHQHQCPVQL